MDLFIKNMDIVTIKGDTITERMINLIYIQAFILFKGEADEDTGRR